MTTNASYGVRAVTPRRMAGGAAPRSARATSTSITAEKQALFDVTVDIPERAVTAFIGPSGCGKSTFLRCINRMNDTIPIARVTGQIEIDGQDINDRDLDVVQLRARVGMVFQKPNPFPKSIYENVAYGPRIHGWRGRKADFDEIVERACTGPGCSNEVKDRLQNPEPACRAASSSACASRALSR